MGSVATGSAGCHNCLLIPVQICQQTTTYSLRGAVHLFSIKKQAGFPTCLLLTAMFNRSAALSGTHLCAKYQHGALSNIMKCHDYVNFTEGEQVMVIRKLLRKKYVKLFDKL